METGGKHCGVDSGRVEEGESKVGAERERERQRRGWW
jgi:hypothetical protein